MARTATIVRETSESKVELSLNLDGTGKTDIDIRGLRLNGAAKWTKKS